ncbi:MAG: hypothetical protein QOD00_1904 [Blastocatellia bacterium]|nr:hypothetical protein [Blastocatellia bacterium]
MMEAGHLSGWTPIRVFWRQSRPQVDWILLEEKRFTEPFFEQTTGQAMHHPFNQLFRRQTPIEALLDLESISQGIAPSGFIFHMSRCGSTLISQMLAALPSNIVISEAPPIDTILRAHLRDPAITDDERLAWFRAMLNALGQRRHATESRLFIKFHAWQTLDLPLIRRAFPDVPWIFVYRDPLEVMVSHERNRGGQLLPGSVRPALLGLDISALGQMTLDEYGARVLALFCDAALRNYESGNGLFVNYRQLPESVFSSLSDFFKLSYNADEIERMRLASRFDAKTPTLTFKDDTEEKRLEATNALRRLADQWVVPLYEKLIARSTC